ncbi:hypothetical protein [Mammaliicoccus vitulinus]
MKLLDEIYAYQGQLSLQELYDYIGTLNDRVNSQIQQGTEN